MVFAHFTEIALQAAAALVNTQDGDDDALTDLAGLDEFVREWGWSAGQRRTQAELDEVRALRSRLRRLWGLNEEAFVSQINAMLREAKALPQLVRHDEWHYHLHATPPGARLADRMAVEAAMAFSEVVLQQEVGRLGICEATDCDAVRVDLSRNRSRRYCSTSCLNRVTVAAFRARHR